MRGGWTVAEPGRLDGTVVWTVDVAAASDRIEACATVLSEEEMARAGRLRRAEDRARLLVGHAALRLILGRALGAEPGALSFSGGPAGKPELAGPWAGALRFNLSHSGDRALVGLSRDGAIGVDVEALRPMPDAARVARSYFSAQEAAALAALPDAEREPAFMAVWTRKEAVVKALGAGLSMPLHRFSVCLPPAEPRILASTSDDLDPAAFTLRHLEPGPGTVGAAAVAAPDVSLHLGALPPGWAGRIA